MAEGWLLYNREEYDKNRAFADLFPAEGKKRGLEITLKFREELVFTLRNGAFFITPHEEPLPAFAINRTRDWAFASLLEQGGCRVFNSSEVSRVANDKALSHALAARLGLPQVDMALCQNAPIALKGHGLGYPVVLKSPYGHGGREVFLARNEAELLGFAAGLHCDRLLVQRLCGRPGADVRVYTLGGEILSAVKRSSSSDFRANLSLGGDVEPYELNDDNRHWVMRILEELKPDYAGVDFIFDADGNLLFNEIEDAVGARSLYRLGRLNVAGSYLDYISTVLSKRKP